MYVEKVPHRGSRPASLLREAKREGKKTVKRTIANLSKLPDEAIDALRLILKGVALCDASTAFAVKSSVPCGHVHAVRLVMNHLGMAELISPEPSRERNLILALITQRLINPSSQLESVKQLFDTSIGTDFELSPETDEDAIDGAMGWLLGQRTHLEKRLAARHLSNGATPFYYLSSSSCPGTGSSLAEWWDDWGGLKPPAVAYGLLTDAEGRPVSIRVHAENSTDPVPVLVRKLRKAFGLERVVWVGGCGTLTGARIQELRKTGVSGWVSCLRSGDVSKLFPEDGSSGIPLSPPEKPMEISHPDFPGERLIVCVKPSRKAREARTRNDVHVIRTSEPAERLPAADAVRAYKALGNIGKGLRIFDGIDIQACPGRNQVSDRMRAHIFLCMLTWYVEWHMRRALSSLLYGKGDLSGARAAQPPVAKAATAMESKRRKRTSATGFELQSWRGLISALGAQCRIMVETNGVLSAKDAEPNAFQAEVFRLLSEDSPLWGPEREPPGGRNA